MCGCVLGSCFLQTTNLDGETNFNVRRSLPATQSTSEEEFESDSNIHGVIECSPPNHQIYSVRCHVHSIWVLLMSVSVGETTSFREFIAVGSPIFSGVSRRVSVRCCFFRTVSTHSEVAPLEVCFPVLSCKTVPDYLLTFQCVELVTRMYCADPLDKGGARESRVSHSSRLQISAKELRISRTTPFPYRHRFNLCFCCNFL